WAHRANAGEPAERVDVYVNHRRTLIVRSGSDILGGHEGSERETGKQESGKHSHGAARISQVISQAGVIPATGGYGSCHRSRAKSYNVRTLPWPMRWPSSVIVWRLPLGSWV